MPGFLQRTLQRSRERLGGAISRLLPGSLQATDLERLEQALIAADVGPETALELVEQLRADAAAPQDPKGTLVRLMQEVLAAAEGIQDSGSERPQVWLLVGVNGSGKTTSCAKLARWFQRRGDRVLLGAADTFRAAAVEQLRVWGRRLDVPVIAHPDGGDPAAVAFDACESARARALDVAIIDTAGRLHTQGNLMAEIDKIRRTVGRVIPGAPHEVLLVLDATTGQNGLRQAEQFLEHAGVTGMLLAKLDGTAKGGIALCIARQLGLPIRFVGTGEGLDDLHEFDAAAYVEALIGEEVA